MFPFSLKFKNPSLEKKYSEFKWKFNEKPGIYLLAFNFNIEFLVSIFAIIQGAYKILFYNISLFMSVLILFYLSRKAKTHKNVQTFYIVYSIVVSYQVELQLMSWELVNNQAGHYEWFFCGTFLMIFISFISKFRMSWIFAISSRVLAISYVLYQSLNEPQNSKQAFIMLIIMIFLGIGGDYNQDKNDRESFLTEYNFANENHIYRNLIEWIPDQVLIWNSQKLVFANQSSFNLFKEKDLNTLQEALLKNIELVDFGSLVEKLDKNTINIERKSQFFEKIRETLGVNGSEMELSENLPLLTANVRRLNELKESTSSEYDLKMRKISWENHDAVLVLLSSVDEKNVKSRLEYVNSFLNYVLGNVSHELCTPFNILLGLLQTSIQRVQHPEVLKDLKIAKNMGEILINMFYTMIDLFNIRKGSIFLKVEVVNMHEELQKTMNLFEEILQNREITVKIDESLPILWTDRRRVQQLLIGIMNYSLKHVQKTELLVHARKTHGLCYEIVIKAFSNKNISFMMDQPKFLKEIMMNKVKSSQMISSNESILLDSGMNFSMLNYLVLILSGGKSKQVHIEGNSLFSFQIHDVTKSMKLNLRDLLLDQKRFDVNYVKQFEFLGNQDCDSIDEIISVDDSKVLVSTLENTAPVKLDKYKNKFNQMPNLVNNNSPSFCFSSPFIQTNKHARVNSFPDSPFPRSNFEKAPLFCINKKHTVLNVDDNFLNLTVITKYCRDYGIEVIEANNGIEAIQEVKDLLSNRRLSFDLIFMDCDMPLLDGFDASKRINEIYLENKRFVPCIIAITANAMNEELNVKMKRNGMKELLLKPLSIDQFKDLVIRYLNL